ncbi:hypothetical protein Lal_00049293 [Lupinus albus]|nr:hypothetical protein Lal_00049293 [Lupinus albus]
MVAMRKDPKAGGGVDETCKVTKDQTQHTPSDFGSSYEGSFGSSDVASFGSSDVASFGSSDVASFGSSDVASFGSSDVASFGSSDVTSFGSSDVAKLWLNDSVHSVTFPDFDHSVHSENMAQPPIPPGPIGDMTPFEAKCLIEKITSNSQQFNARSGDAIVVTGFHDVGTNAARQDKRKTKLIPSPP